MRSIFVFRFAKRYFEDKKKDTVFAPASIVFFFCELLWILMLPLLFFITRFFFFQSVFSVLLVLFFMSIFFHWFGLECLVFFFFVDSVGVTLALFYYWGMLPSPYNEIAAVKLVVARNRHKRMLSLPSLLAPPAPK